MPSPSHPNSSNLRAFQLAVQTLLHSPAQFLPHLTIPTFTHLPEQLGPALQSTTTTSPSPSPEEKEKETKQKPITIRALVLDKDNTLCPPNSTTIPAPILSKLRSLRTSPSSPFNRVSAPSSILIVSNRAGSHPRYDYEIQALEAQLSGRTSTSTSTSTSSSDLNSSKPDDLNLHIPIFRLPEGSAKKPFCGREVLQWFQERGVVTRADEIAVVGDRLGTDVLMAAQMGAWSVWCRDGVGEVRNRGVLEKMEVWVERYLREKRGLRAPVPVPLSV